MKKRVKQSKSQKEPSAEELGKMLLSIYESGYLDRITAYKTSFIKGILAGLGGAIGATLVLAVVVWFLGLFSSVPLVGRFVENLEQT